jgi:hypothetical protein
MIKGWFKVQQAVEKGLPCFDKLSMHGFFSIIQVMSARPERVEGLRESFSTAVKAGPERSEGSFYACDRSFEAQDARGAHLEH